MTLPVSKPDVVVSLSRCRDCGEHHENGGEAMECDHKLLNHQTRPFIWKTPDGIWVGCVSCLKEHGRYI